MPNASDLIVQRLCERGKHRLAFRDGYQLTMLSRMWRNYVAREDRFNRYAEMTSHGLAHVDGVATLLTDLSLASSFLSDGELFLLLAAAYLHDIGMYRTFDRFYREPLKIRAMHGYYSRLGVLREPHLLLPSLDADEVAQVALLCSYHQGKAALSEDDLSRIRPEKRMQVPASVSGSRAAGETVLVEQKSLQRELAEGQERGQDLFRLKQTGEDVCPFLLAALLKLLDGCDYQVGRAGSIEVVLRHADRNRSHAYRSRRIMDDCLPGSDSHERARAELDFFEGSLFHFARNLLVDRSMILGQQDRLCVAIRMAEPDRIAELCQLMVGVDGRAAQADEVMAHLASTADLLQQYQVDPLKTAAEVLKCDPTDARLAEWQIPVPEACRGDRQTVHFGIAADYMQREFRAVGDAITTPAPGRDYHYCGCCPNRQRCSLKQRRIPSFRNESGAWNIVPFDGKQHRQQLRKLPYLAPTRSTPAQPALERPVDDIVQWLVQNRRGVLYGPVGRGKTSLASSVVRKLTGGEPQRVLWHEVERGEGQSDSLWRELAAFLAHNGEFSLQNLIRGEQITATHEALGLRLLRSRPLAAYPGRFVLCIDDFNRLEKSQRAAFWGVIGAFPCVNCTHDATQCPTEQLDRLACPLARSCVLLVSTRVPGAGHRDSGGLDVAPMLAPVLTEAEARQAAERRTGAAAADQICRIWADYGMEPAGIGLLPSNLPGLYPASLCAEAFGGAMAEFFVSQFGQAGLGSLAEYRVMRAAGLLADVIGLGDLERMMGVPAADPAGPIQSLAERGLLRGSTQPLWVHPAWSRGDRRSRWLNRVSGESAALLAAFAAVCEDPAVLSAEPWQQAAAQHGFESSRIGAVVAGIGAVDRTLGRWKREWPHRFQWLVGDVAGGAAPFARLSWVALMRLAAMGRVLGEEFASSWSLPGAHLERVQRMLRLVPMAEDLLADGPVPAGSAAEFVRAAGEMVDQVAILALAEGSDRGAGATETAWSAVRECVCLAEQPRSR